MKDNLIAATATAGLLLAVTGIVLIPTYFIERAECNRIDSNGTNTEFRAIGGCYVEVNGRLIPKESWRGEYELTN